MGPARTPAWYGLSALPCLKMGGRDGDDCLVSQQSLGMVWLRWLSSAQKCLGHFLQADPPATFLQSVTVLDSFQHCII